MHDTLTRKLTAFPTFAAMVQAPGNYRPTLMCFPSDQMPDGCLYTALADAYDAEQARRGDPRRAYRGCRGKDCQSLFEQRKEN